MPDQSQFITVGKKSYNLDLITEIQPVKRFPGGISVGGLDRRPTGILNHPPRPNYQPAPIPRPPLRPKAQASAPPPIVGVKITFLNGKIETLYGDQALDAFKGQIDRPATEG